MIPATNYDDNDNYSVAITGYSSPEITHNYVNYKI